MVEFVMKTINIDLDELVKKYPILNTDWTIERGKNCLIEKISKIVRMNMPEDSGSDQYDHLQGVARDCRGIYIGINSYFVRLCPRPSISTAIANKDPWNRPFPNYLSGNKVHGNTNIEWWDFIAGVPARNIATVHATTVSSNRVYCVDVYT